MREAPEPVLLYIPLMKELNMSWKEITSTPRYELEGLLRAWSEHENLHSMDGYDDKDINHMAKDKPQIRQQWIKYLETKRKYYKSMQAKPSFSSLM